MTDLLNSARLDVDPDYRALYLAVDDRAII